MKDEALIEIENKYKKILEYLYNELCDNKMVKVEHECIKSDSEIEDNKSLELKFKLNNFFEESVLFTFTFEKNVKDFWGSLISKNFELKWQEISLGENININEFIEEIYDLVIQDFIYYMKKTLAIDFNDIIAISSMYYEGVEANGNIYFFLDNTESISIKILDQENNQTKMCYEDIRKVRKNLEMTYDEEATEDFVGLAFVYEKNEWVYRGIVNNAAIKTDTSYFRFHFSKHMVWELYQKDIPVISYKCGKYLKPEENYEDNYNKAITKAFNIESSDLLKSILNEAIKQKHGTILVILDEKNNNAETEVERLVKQSVGTRVRASNRDSKFIRRLTSVDGALIIDSAGEILAYGVILDYYMDENIKKNKEGKNTYNSGRGSRYTSSIKYIESLNSRNIQGVVIIVSEDGMVNIYSTQDKIEGGIDK